MRLLFLQVFGIISWNEEAEVDWHGQGWSTRNKPWFER